MPLGFPLSSGSGGGPWGPADITDRTRRLWRGATEWTLTAAGPNMGVVALYLWPYWALDPAANESIVTTLHIPADWASGALTAKVFYWCPNTSAGTIQLGLMGRPIGDGNLLDIDAYPANPGTACAAPGVANQMKVVTLTSSLFSGQISQGEASQVVLIRYATDPADTYASDVYVAGVLFEYTADA